MQQNAVVDYPRAAAPPWVTPLLPSAAFCSAPKAVPRDAAPRGGRGRHWALPDGVRGLRGFEAACTHSWGEDATTEVRGALVSCASEVEDAGDALAACVSQLSLGTPTACRSVLPSRQAPHQLASCASSPRGERLLTFFRRLAEADPERFREAAAAATAEMAGLRAQADSEALALRARWEEGVRAQRERAAEVYEHAGLLQRLAAWERDVSASIEAQLGAWRAAREAELEAELAARVDAWRAGLQAEAAEAAKAAEAAAALRLSAVEAEAQAASAWRAARAAAQEAATAASERCPTCVICLDQAASYAFVPCGHRCVCASCTQRLPPSHRGRCPQCRQASSDLIRIW